MNNKIFIKSILLFLFSISVVTTGSYSHGRFVYSHDYPVKTNVEQTFTPEGFNSLSFFSLKTFFPFIFENVCTTSTVNSKNRLSLLFFNQFFTEQLKILSTYYLTNKFIHFPQKKIFNLSPGEDPFHLS